VGVLGAAFSLTTVGGAGEVSVTTTSVPNRFAGESASVTGAGIGASTGVLTVLVSSSSLSFLIKESFFQQQ
jgi:hypothetical protein